MLKSLFFFYQFPISEREREGESFSNEKRCVNKSPLHRWKVLTVANTGLMFELC